MDSDTEDASKLKQEFSTVSMEGSTIRDDSSVESYIAKGRNKNIEQPKAEK